MRFGGSSFVLLALALTGLMGCGDKSSSGGFSSRSSGGNANILRYALATSPTTLDPAKVQDIETMDVLGNIFEGLVGYDEKNQIVGMLAESWTTNSSGTVYTFKLRDTKFHNGSPVTAKDVKASWERALSLELASPTAGTYLDDIVGADLVVNGKAKELSGVKVIDEKTLEVSITGAKAYFLGKLTYACAFVVPAGQGNKEISKLSEVVGFGPFSLKSYQPEQSLTLAKNATYHAGAPQIDEIQRNVVKDAATRLNLYRTGESDIATLEKQDWKAIKNDAKLKDQLQFIKRPAVFYLLLSAKAYAPFKDRHVRRAVMMAIDRERISRDILSGVPTANRWLPDGILADAPKVAALAFDPTAAQAELAKSSFKTGAQLPELQLTVRAENADARYVAEAISNDLKKNLGIRANPRTLE